uniref:ER membrane protein complex subunit 2 n=1 Tax=Timema poppense TaxID=170557 RepID=A0A7R9CTX3_TIMPO|nr:unnamed protein product [Timema poppensis]
MTEEVVSERTLPPILFNIWQEGMLALSDLIQPRFMSDQEGWQELSELYLQEQDFGRAAFCMEELILHNPHSHLIHQHYAEIKYTQASILHLA